LSFVPNLADARSSDRLGVQLLYLDRGWKFPHQPEFPHTGDPGGRCRALLSNRVELVVP
jgi:hypothetical protein